MRVRLLGGFDVEGVSERDLGSRKARTLLKLLAVRRGTPVGVDAIADALWDDDLPARPAEQVGVLVSRLRGAIGSDRIARGDAGYVLHVDWVDVDEVAALTVAAATALDEGRIGAARAAANAALGLAARGSLLGDEDAAWIEPARAAAGAIVTRARRIATDAALAAGDLDGVVAVAETVLAVDPYDEVVLRALMQAHLSARRPASALSVYGRLRERLAEDLGVPPTAETEAMYAAALAAADGDRPLATPPSAAAPARPRAVGRTRHLEALDDELRHAATGAPRLVVIRGDAGMGKTTLVEAWESQVGDDVVVLRGRCDELGRDLPLQPIADALIDHLRDIGPGAAVDVLGGDAAVLAPILGPLAGDVEDAAATSVVDPEQGRARVFGALLAAVTRAAGSRRAVIVIEDLHDAGPSTVAWLAFAQRRAGRLMLVVTTRDARPVGLSPTRAVSVDALTRDDVAELVGPEHADEVFERTGGHPIFLGAAGEISGAQPVELRDVVTAQLATLDREAAGSTQLAAVAGSDCDVDLIASVRGVPSVDVVRHLESATRTGLVVERGAGFAFRHELIRDAVNATATGAQLVASHHAIAVALSRRPRVDPLAVAVHARDGGADDLATTSFIAAAEAASARFDVDAAEAHLASAIAATPSAPAPYVARARVRMSRSSFADAERDARTAVELGGGAAALEVAGWVAYYRRDYPHARAFAEEALAALPADSPLRVSASALAGRIRHGTGDLLGAVQLLEAPGQAPLAIRGIADVWLAQARLHQGRPLDALDALTRPSVAPDSLAHPWAPLHLRFNRIIALGQLGRGAEAMAVCDELDEVIRREGAVAARFVGPSNNAASWILRWTGRGDEADDRNRAALDASGGDDGPVAESHAEGYYVALLDLVDGRLLADDLAGAEPLIRRLAVVDGWNGTMAWHQRHRLDLQRSRIALADGDRDRATALASAVAVDAAARGARRYELLAIAHAALADDSIPDARLVPVVDGLGRCAQLDGWSLVDRIARQRSVDEWRRVAEDRATAVVAAAGGAADAARRLVERVLSR